MFKITKPVIALLLMSFVFGASAQDEEIAGVWQSVGYGMWFDVSEDAVNIYQATEASCVVMVDIPEIDYTGDFVQLKDVSIAGLGAVLGTFEYELTLEQGLLHFNPDKINAIQAQRADELPAQCQALTPNTPEDSFETFWHMFNEHYAFFQLRGVDWQAAYENYRPQVTAETSDEELFEILQEMIAPLGDGHVALHSMFNSFSPITLPEWIQVIEDESQIGELAQLPGGYLTDEPQFLANDLLIYGPLSETVGYLQIAGFDGFSEDGDSRDVLQEAMTTILAEFAEMESIVVDVRFNFGGSDVLAFFVAGYFTDESLIFADKSVWFEGDFSPIMKISLEPSTDTPYLGDVYLLTSGLTISAAETFSLAMRSLPHVTQVGEPTNGILSDAWFAVLPNGWLASLSNERYLSEEGVLYEAVGIPADIEVLFTAEDFATGNDPMLEAVLGLVD